MNLTIQDGIEMIDGNRIPRMGFGTYDIADEAAVVGAVTCAIEAGYRLIDCARFYGNEKAVGKALCASGIPRGELFVTSKVWNDRQIDGTVRESVEESLRDLRLDYLDLLLIHWPVEDKFVDTWKTFIELRNEGLVSSIGVSNHRTAQFTALIDETGVTPAVNQMERHPYLQDEDTLAFCNERGIVFEAWSPLGRGTCLDDPVIEGIAEAHGASAAQVILAWHMEHGVVPLPRSQTPERIRQNAEAVNLKLTGAEIAAIDALDKGAPVIEGIDPENFADFLNPLSSHFD